MVSFGEIASEPRPKKVSSLTNGVGLALGSPIVATKHLTIGTLTLDGESVDLHSRTVWLSVEELEAGDQVLDGLRDGGGAALVRSSVFDLLGRAVVSKSPQIRESAGVGDCDHIEETTLVGVTFREPGNSKGPDYPTVGE